MHPCRHCSVHWRVMDEKVLPLNQVSCNPLCGIEECQAQQTLFKWISQEIVSPMPPQRGGRPPRGQSFTLPVAKAWSWPNIVAFLGGSTPKRSRNFTFTVSMVSPG
jgi:hypothetical protein